MNKNVVSLQNNVLKMKLSSPECDKRENEKGTNWNTCKIMISKYETTVKLNYMDCDRKRQFT